MNFLSLLNEGVLRSTQDYYVYGYYESGAHEPFYVGKGRGERMFVHLTEGYLCRKDFFHNKLRGMIARGLKPLIEKIQGMLTEAEALDYERCLISIYDRRNNGTGCLCNLTDGGEGSSGYRHTEEAIKKMQIRSRNQEFSLDTRIKLSHLHSKPCSQEKRLKIQRIRIEQCGQAIESYNLKTGELIKRYEAISLVKEDNYQRASVRLCALGLQKHHQGLGWRFV